MQLSHYFWEVLFAYLQILDVEVFRKCKMKNLMNIFEHFASVFNHEQ